ncbi:MAG: RES family NAD+ phosphorylase [Gluconacetobacter diazotrophicus]|nr:RES family NAD+ phosphorylase [Gluconacetobacter diazotrophicus]
MDWSDTVEPREQVLDDLPLPPVVDVLKRDTIRLVPSGRLKPPVLAPLATTEQGMLDLATLEGVTNTRLRAASSGLTGLDPRELAFGRANESFVNAAFTHVRPGGNRFNDGARGAWYCGFDAATALDEVAYHLTRELDAIGRYRNVTDYAELVADFVGPFHDLRGHAFGDDDCLSPDVDRAYRRGQALASRLLSRGSNGIVYPSVRRAGGICLVAFRPALVQNVRQGGLWRLTWDGARQPRVEAAPG